MLPSIVAACCLAAAESLGHGIGGGLLGRAAYEGPSGPENLGRRAHEPGIRAMLRMMQASGTHRPRSALWWGLMHTSARITQEWKP